MPKTEEYCLKFHDLTTNIVTYGFGTYSKAEAESLASKFNADDVRIEVSAVPASERGPSVTSSETSNN
jgi:hypothetical protein